jgi:hypothetical protein
MNEMRGKTPLKNDVAPKPDDDDDDYEDCSDEDE